MIHWSAWSCQKCQTCEGEGDGEREEKVHLKTHATTLAGVGKNNRQHGNISQSRPKLFCFPFKVGHHTNIGGFLLNLKEVLSGKSFGIIKKIMYPSKHPYLPLKKPTKKHITPNGLTLFLGAVKS